MTAPLPLLASALVLGFAGSVHCVGMCGGIAGALAQAGPRRGPAGAALRSLLHSAGRIASYATAGAVAGAFGSLFAISPAAFAPIRIALGLLIVALGLQIAWGGRTLAALERAGQAVWRLVSPLTRRIGRPDHAWQVFAMGMVWGFLPCGLVYSALLVAAASGEPATGALAMAAFGIGTLPAVLAASGLGAALARLGGAASVRRSAGLLLVVFGLWSVLGTWAMTGRHAAHAAHAHVHHGVHHGHAEAAQPAATDTGAPTP